ncbi:MAG: SPOCS domain-containing protein [Evtepia sp.]
MELELQRESVRCWETVCRTTLEQEETAETIVPDACPDIWQVLDGEGRLLLQRKEPQEGKAELSGLLKVTILYQPEGEETMESMEVTLPFSLSPDLPQLTRRCLLRVTPRVLSVDVHLLNPRKVLVRVGYQLEVEGFSPQTLSPASMAQEGEDYGVRQRTDTLRSMMTVYVQEKTFTYSDTVTLPAGRPDVQSLLRTRAECTCTEARVIGSKLVFKGEAVLTLLCKGTDGGVFSADLHLPYSQIMDAGEESEEGLCGMDLFFTDVTCIPEGEDPRAFQVELAIQAQAVLRRQVEVPVLADLYSTDYQLQTETSPFPVRSLLGSGEDQETAREVLEHSGALGEIFDVQARLGRTGQRQEGQDRILTQEVELVVLCQGEEGPVTLSKRVTVSHRLPERGETPCLLTVEVLRAPTASVTGTGAEVTVPLLFRWMALEDRMVSLADRVTLGDRREEAEERPSVILRAVRAGETLWDVAKACLSTDSEIMEASALTSPELYPGQMLLIPGRR